MTGSFAAEVMCMMYVAGDVEEPDVRTAEYVETIGKILNEWFRLLHKKLTPTLTGFDILNYLEGKKVYKKS